MSLFGLIRAFFKGEALLKAETWKNTQLATETLVVVLIAVLAFMPDLGVSQSQIILIAGSIATLVNIALTVLTTKKIGLPPEGKVYEKVIEKTSTDNTYGDIDWGNGDWVRGTDYTDPEPNVPVPDKARVNSVNSGGKGLLGGN